MLQKTFFLEGIVAKGFGRGGKQLNCPTANIEIQNLEERLKDYENGVYYGWAVWNIIN